MSIDIRVPDIGDFKDVPVIEVMVKVGDTVAVEQSLVTLESDKASMDVPSSAAGVVQEVLVKVGDRVGEGHAIVRLATAGAGPGIEAQVNDAMDRLGRGLKANRLDWPQVTAANVWLGDLALFSRMNKAYGAFWGPTPPARTTVQPLPVPAAGPLVRISLLAVE